MYHCLPANPRKIKSIAHVIFRLIEKPGLNAVPQEWSEPGRQAMLVVIMACLYQYHPELYRLVEHYPRFYEQLRLWANGDRVEFEHEVFSPRNLQLSLARPPSGADADERRPTPSKAQVDTFPDPVRGNVLRIQSLIRDLGPVPGVQSRPCQRFCGISGLFSARTPLSSILKRRRYVNMYD